MDKTHIQHSVGFVQHQDFDLGQIYRALPGMVQQAAGGGDEDIHATPQLADLGVNIHPAKHNGCR